MFAIRFERRSEPAPALGWSESPLKGSPLRYLRFRRIVVGIVIGCVTACGDPSSDSILTPAASSTTLVAFGQAIDNLGYTLGPTCAGGDTCVDFSNAASIDCTEPTTAVVLGFGPHTIDGVIIESPAAGVRIFCGEGGRSPSITPMNDDPDTAPYLRIVNSSNPLGLSTFTFPGPITEVCLDSSTQGFLQSASDLTVTVTGDGNPEATFTVNSNGVTTFCHSFSTPVTVVGLTNKSSRRRFRPGHRQPGLYACHWDDR